MYENDVEDYRNPDGFCERCASLRIMCLDKMCVVNVDAHLSREKKKDISTNYNRDVLKTSRTFELRNF